MKAKLAALWRQSWFRWGLGLVLAVVAAYLLWDNAQFVQDGWHVLVRADLRWIAAGIAMQALAMYAMAEVMRLLLRTADVPATRRGTNSLVLAANAWSATAPGGPVFATALSFRQQQKWGAPVVVVSWQIMLSGAMSALGLASLAIISFFFFDTNFSPRMVVGPLIAIAVLSALMWWASRNTPQLKKWAISVVQYVNKLPGGRPGRGEQGVADAVDALTAVKLSPGRLLLVFAWSLTNWLADLLCLWFAAQAVGVDLSLGGALLAFVGGKIAGSVPVTPGGIGTVEAVLTGALVAAGAPTSGAFAATLAYRMVSFVLVAVVGWVCFFLLFRGKNPARGTVSDEATSQGTTNTTS